jgi:hypothetical protein
MTTASRAVRHDPRAGSQASNFHAPAALDSYSRRFARIGIASVAAAAAQVRPAASVSQSRRDADIPAIFRGEDDAA